MLFIFGLKFIVCLLAGGLFLLPRFAYTTLRIVFQEHIEDRTYKRLDLGFGDCEENMLNITILTIKITRGHKTVFPTMWYYASNVYKQFS